jgi:hypothetical protein
MKTHSKRRSFRDQCFERFFVRKQSLNKTIRFNDLIEFFIDNQIYLTVETITQLNEKRKGIQF